MYCVPIAAHKRAINATTLEVIILQYCLIAFFFFFFFNSIDFLIGSIVFLLVTELLTFQIFQMIMKLLIFFTNASTAAKLQSDSQPDHLQQSSRILFLSENPSRRLERNRSRDIKLLILHSSGVSTERLSLKCCCCCYHSIVHVNYSTVKIVIYQNKDNFIENQIRVNSNNIRRAKWR